MDHVDDYKNPGFPCPTCDKRFRQKCKLNRHIKVKHSYDEAVAKPYLCADCNKRFTEKTFLVAHMHIHTRETPYPCNDCDKAFASKSLLKRHQKYTHASERQYSCFHCEKKFKCKAHLVGHMKTHLPKDKRDKNDESISYACSMCSKSFSKRKSLSRHMNDVHVRVKDYQCDICDNTYGRRYLLLEHIMKHKMTGKQGKMRKQSQKSQAEKKAETNCIQTTDQDLLKTFKVENEAVSCSDENDQGSVDSDFDRIDLDTATHLQYSYQNDLRLSKSADSSSTEADTSLTHSDANVHSQDCSVQTEITLLTTTLDTLPKSEPPISIHEVKVKEENYCSYDDTNTTGKILCSSIKMEKEEIKEEATYERSDSFENNTTYWDVVDDFKLTKHF